MDSELIERAIIQSEDELAALAQALSGYVLARKRPKASSPDTCHIFIDECGSHSLTAKESFNAFALAAIIVKDIDFPSLDEKWKGWKDAKLGSPEKLVHEPDLRRGNGSFYCGGDAARRLAAHEALENLIPNLPFTGIACILNRPEYMRIYGEQPLDASLPLHPYLMTLHFVIERAAMALQEKFAGAKAHIVIESRGPKEDAAMQYELARLFIDGTSFVSASYFRHQFFPGIVFKSKDTNCTGLQLADLLARPCAEKALAPATSPPRWNVFKRKLCDGQFTQHSILGLKIVPWDDRYDGIWES
jgi:hypothetical protein